MTGKTPETSESIEVASVRFTAAEVKTATIERDGRRTTIGEQSQERQIGFGRQDR